MGEAGESDETGSAGDRTRTAAEKTRDRMRAFMSISFPLSGEREAA